MNVSEISLRRWTNSGQLSCLRVGAHRARRFRRADLLAFMERQSAQQTAVSTIHEHTNQAPYQTQVSLEGVSIEYGNHLCSLYDSDVGLHKLSVPLLADGLRLEDTCFLIATQATRKMILQQLDKIGLNVKSLLDKGQLIISEGKQTGSEMLEYFQEQFTDATRTGNRSLRLVGDMSWTLAKGWLPAELNTFELNYNHSLGHQYPIVSLCQYDVREFSGVSVLNALRCHEDTFRFPISRFLNTSPLLMSPNN